MEFLHQATYKFVSAVGRRRKRGDDVATAVLEGLDDVAEEAVGVRAVALYRAVQETRAARKPHRTTSNSKNARRRARVIKAPEESAPPPANAEDPELARLAELKRIIDSPTEK